MLVKGSIVVMSGVEFDFAALPALQAPGIPPLWATGVIFGLVTVVALKRYSHFLLLPGLILGISLSPLRNNRDEIVGRIVNFQDLTEIRAMEAQMQSHSCGVLGIMTSCAWLGSW